MHCQNCGTVLPDGTPSCPTCGMHFAEPRTAQEPGQPTVLPPGDTAPVQDPPPAQDEPEPAPARKRRLWPGIAIVLGVLVLLAAAAATVLLRLPSQPTPPASMPPAYAPVMPQVSTETSGAPGSSVSTATPESVVTTFYATANAGDFSALKALVTSDTRSAVDPGAFKRWKSTTFTIARTTVNGGSASVYGHESRREFGSSTLGVKFTLLRVGGTWLIKGWQAVDEGIINGAMPSSGQGITAPDLSADVARDVVTTLLEARQKGDAASIRLVTTAKFQAANSDVWLDGVDNSQFFTAFSIRSLKKKGAVFVVTVLESWNSGDETATYTVVLQNGSVLVDSWTSK